MTDHRPSNRWLARVGDEIAGQHSTPAMAVAEARQRFPDSTPTLTYVESETSRPLTLSPLLEQLRPLLDNLEMPVYLVGGAVRDAVLNRVSHDLDLGVPEGAIDLAFSIGDALRVPAYVLDNERDVGRVILPEWQTTIDIARFRGPNLEADLYGRDFTVNALALPATAHDVSSILDMTNGLADLRAGLIRMIHSDSLTHDPIRTLRAVRQALQFGFELTPETAVAIESAALTLSRTSSERIRDELTRLMAGAQPDQAVRQMAQLGLLSVVLPEVAALDGVAQSVPHHEPVLEHTISVLRWLVLVELQIAPASSTGDPALQAIADLLRPYRLQIQHHLSRPVEGALVGHDLLRWGGLFHDTGKRATQTIGDDGRIRFLGHDDVGAGLASRRMKTLSFSNEAAEHVSRITQGHMRPLHLAASDTLPTRRAMYRFYRATREAGVDIILLSLADHLATYDGPGPEEAWAHLLRIAGVLLSTYYDSYEDVVKPVRLLTGSDLIVELEITPGREIGRLLAEIEEAQAAGHIATREEALDLARTLRDEA